MAEPVEAILEQRNSTHGSFADNARISQALKELFVVESGWTGLTAVQREALDMIALKLSRILSGRASEPDHWADIAGYATLAVRELNETS